MKIKHWKPQQKKPNTFFIDALKIVCVIRHHLKIPVKYIRAPGHKYSWSWRLANCREDNGSSELMKPVRVSLSNLSPSLSQPQLPQWPVYSVYCNNEAGVNNSLICTIWARGPMGWQFAGGRWGDQGMGDRCREQGTADLREMYITSFLYIQISN